MSKSSGTFRCVRSPSSVSLVDDACVFEGSVSPPTFPASTASAARRLHSRSRMTDDLRSIQQPDVGQHSANSVVGLTSIPGQGKAFKLLPGPELGYYAQREPLSLASHQRLHASLEHDAPESVLAEIRKLARKSEHTGISAYFAYRDKERRAAPKYLRTNKLMGGAAASAQK